MNGPLGINQDNITFDFCQPENSETPLKNKPEHDVTSEFSFSEPIVASPSGKRIVKKSQKIMDAMETERILNKSPDLYSKFLERQNFLSPTADPVESPEPEEVPVLESQETELVDTELPETEVVDTELPETEDTPKIQGSALVDDLLSKTPKRSSRTSRKTEASKESTEVTVEPEAVILPPPTPFRTSKATEEAVKEAEPAPTPRRTSRSAKQAQDPEPAPVPAPTPKRTSKTSKAVVVEAEQPQEPQVQDLKVTPVSAPTPRRTSRTSKAVEEPQEPRVQDPEVTPVPAPTPRRTSKSSKAVVAEAQTEQVPTPRRTSRTSKAVNETEAAGLEIQGSTQEYPETEVTVSAVLATTEGTPVKKRGRPPKAAKEGMHNNSKKNGGVLSFVCTNIKKKPEKVTRNVTCLHHI